MKRFRIIITLALVVSAVACTTIKYDEDPINNRIEGLNTQIAKLEQMITAMNSDIASVRKLLQAVETDDVITSCVPFEADGRTGYKITFYKHGEIIIYNGIDGIDGTPAEDGEDGYDGYNGQAGHSPVITVKRDTDGKWYWAADGEFLTDALGNKVALTLEVNEGSDGLVPLLKVVDNQWFVSYNNVDWTPLGPATQNYDAPYIFTDVKDNGSNVVFTLVGGDTVTAAKLETLSLTLSGYEDLALVMNQKDSFSYTVSGATPKTKVYATANCGVTVKVVAESVSAGTIELLASDVYTDGDILVYADNGYGQTSMRKLTVKAGKLMLVETSQGYDDLQDVVWN